MLGEVLTAIVTPFRRRRSRSISTASARSAAISSTTAPTASSSPARRARPRRSTDDERFALYEVAVDEVGGHAHGRRRHRHVLDSALGAPHRARARDRRGRLPRRDALLQQAAAAGHRRPRPRRSRPSPTGRSSSTTSRAASSSTPEPATISALAEIPNVRAVKQAKPSLDAAAPSSSLRASISTRVTTI